MLEVLNTSIAGYRRRYFDAGFGIDLTAPRSFIHKAQRERARGGTLRRKPASQGVTEKNQWQASGDSSMPMQTAEEGQFTLKRRRGDGIVSRVVDQRTGQPVTTEEACMLATWSRRRAGRICWPYLRHTKLIGHYRRPRQFRVEEALVGTKAWSASPRSFLLTVFLTKGGVDSSGGEALSYNICKDSMMLRHTPTRDTEASCPRRRLFQ